VSSENASTPPIGPAAPQPGSNTHCATASRSSSAAGYPAKAQPHQPTRRATHRTTQPALDRRRGAGDRFVGAVGTGWTLATARQLLQQLTELHTHASPFNTALPREYTHDARWVQPELIGDVEYRSRTTEV
jgi:hypothetical protein